MTSTGGAMFSGKTLTSSSLPSQKSEFAVGGRYYNRKNERGMINIIIENIAATLDNCKVSYKNSVRNMPAICKALEVDTKNLILNETSFNEQ